MNDTNKDDTLLAHLAWMLSSRHEDIAVEALGFILRSEAARKVIEEVLKDGRANVGSIAKFQTQVGEGKTRPDLVGFDQQDGKCVLIEAKFWAGLTENQPNAYLDRLDTGKALLFVAPPSRVESLWSKLRGLTGNGSLHSICERVDFKSVTTDSRKHLMLISWTHLLDRLEGAGDSHSRVGAQQLRGLAERVDAETEFPPLQPEELAPEIPRRLLGIRRLVDDATARVVDKGYASIGGKVTPQVRGYGRYLRVANAVAWFGIDSDRWAQSSYPDTPLWLHFEEWRIEIPLDQIRDALDRLIQKDPPECFDEGHELFVPIALPIGVEYDAVLDAVVRHLGDIASLISAQEPATAST